MRTPSCSSHQGRISPLRPGREALLGCPKPESDAKTGSRTCPTAPCPSGYGSCSLRGVAVYLISSYSRSVRTSQPPPDPLAKANSFIPEHWVRWSLISVQISPQMLPTVPLPSISTAAQFKGPVGFCSLNMADDKQQSAQ